MALPPKGDPERPLALAVRVARLSGWLMVVLGALWLVPLMFFRPQRHPMLAIFQIRGAMLPLLPGGAFVLLSIGLQRRQLWAAVSTILIAGIQCAFTLYVAVALAISLRRDEVDDAWLFVLATLLLLAAALGQLMFFVAKALRAIRNPPIEEARGFEPVTRE